MTPNEAHLAIHKHLAQAIQYLAGQEDEEAGDDFATLILTDHLDILVTRANDDGSFAATVKLISPKGGISSLHLGNPKINTTQGSE